MMAGTNWRVGSISVFGGLSLKALAPCRDWCAKAQEPEGHLPILGSTRSTEFEGARSDALPTTWHGVLVCPWRAARKAGPGCGLDPQGLRREPRACSRPTTRPRPRCASER